MTTRNLQIRFQPGGIKVQAEEGSSLLEAARRAGFVLQSECGGQGTCRRCKVKILSGDVFLITEPNLTQREKDQGFTLACVARIIGDLEVHVPPTSQFLRQPELIPAGISLGENPGAEITAQGYKLQPLVQRIRIQVPEATIQNSASDFERLCRELVRAGFPPPFTIGVEMLRCLSRVVRQDSGNVNILVHEDDTATAILAFEELSDEPIYGLALDIGTTTLFARILNLESGEVIAETSDFNWQIPCGADIIHRIIYAGKSGGLKELQKLALSAVDSLISRLLESSDIRRKRIIAAALAGNTTMLHLFLGMDPKTIREEPYVPTVTRFPLLTAAQVGLSIYSEAPVFFSPAVASYVGGDITAGLLSAGIQQEDRLTLYMDLGTNGEVALGNKDWLTACACSAGPAFEGSGVRCGMRALPGAIDQVKWDARGSVLTFRVIGGSSPKGICGSGLIDLLAELRISDRITARGKFNPERDPQRIRTKGRKTEFLLAPAEETEGVGDIIITEVDLDNLIRTKGAIFAGVMTLLKSVGLSVDEIERVVIAGGFGRYLNVESAIAIGMFPDLPRDRFEYIGNGSLRGAGLALLSQPLCQQLLEIADRITYFELSTWQGYMDEFMAALFLPHTDLSLFPSLQSKKKR
ncbi:MAG: ASKHA domain-containing protein [bacterium]